MYRLVVVLETGLDGSLQFIIFAQELSLSKVELHVWVVES